MGLFKSAATLNEPKVEKSKSKLVNVEIEGVERLATIDALQKTLDAIRAESETPVKAATAQRFIAHIQATGQRPDSFVATEGTAEATLTLTRRGSHLALTDAAVALLREHGIEPHESEITPELFGINPKYAGDSILLAKVEKALTKVVPDDFLVKQEKVSKFVVDESVLNAALEKRAPAEVIAAITTITCKPRLAQTNVGAILEFVRNLIAPIEPAEALGAALAARSAKSSKRAA